MTNRDSKGLIRWSQQTGGTMDLRLDIGDWAIVAFAALVAVALAAVWFKHKVLDNADAQQDARRLLWRAGQESNRPFTRQERLLIGLGLFRVSQKPETVERPARSEPAEGEGEGCKVA